MTAGALPATNCKSRQRKAVEAINRKLVQMIWVSGDMQAPARKRVGERLWLQVIRLVALDLERTVDLFEEDYSHELVGKGHLREADAVIGALKGPRGEPRGPSYQERYIAPPRKAMGGQHRRELLRRHLAPGQVARDHR